MGGSKDQEYRNSADLNTKQDFQQGSHGVIRGTRGRKNQSSYLEVTACYTEIGNSQMGIRESQLSFQHSGSSMPFRVT